MTAGRHTVAAFVVTAIVAALPAASQTLQEKPKSPLVMAAGCAAPTDQPHIWMLSRAGELSASSQPAINAAEKEQAAKRPLGQDTYQLIGVADFVDVETARTIGVRGEILPAPRVNTTAMLVNGRKVAVKGLYIEARPPRINLTSVADLGGRCR